MTDLNAIVLAACRAHSPQFDRMDFEIQKYALEQMRAALTVGVAELVQSGRSIIDHGGDQDYAAFDAALEPFDELIPYDSTIEADISAAMSNSEELPYECDACTTPGYGHDAPCQCSPAPQPAHGTSATERVPNVDVEDIREQKLATIVAPDNGTPHEVLAAVLECARAWVPEARIIGNVRAGDIARAIEAIPAPAPAPETACEICGGRHDNDVLTDICTSCEARINEEGSP